ncbi:MAG: hypothetical protein ACI80K_001656 [Paracoccaceae bacterium]|jgi:hypothetical protein
MQVEVTETGIIARPGHPLSLSPDNSPPAPLRGALPA